MFKFEIIAFFGGEKSRDAPAHVSELEHAQWGDTKNVWFEISKLIYLKINFDERVVKQLLKKLCWVLIISKLQNYLIFELFLGKKTIAR